MTSRSEAAITTITERLAALPKMPKSEQYTTGPYAWWSFEKARADALFARLVLAVELLRTCGNGEMTSEDYRDVELFLAHIDKERT